MGKRLSAFEKGRICEVSAVRCVRIIKNGFALSNMNIYNAICASLRSARPDCFDSFLNEPTLSREQLDCLTTRTQGAIKTQLRQSMQRGEWSPASV